MSTEILTPNLSWYKSTCTVTGADAVIAVTDGDDATYLSNSISTWKYNFYKLPCPVPAVGGAIQSVAVCWRGYDSGHSETQQASAKPCLYIGSTEYYGDVTLLPLDPTDFSYTWNTNPATSAAWTWADLTSLLLGIGIAETLGTASGGKVTELYLLVTYTGDKISIVTLRPDAAGSNTDIPTQYPASEAHYDKVLEEVADGDSTYLQSDNSSTFYTDTFNCPNSLAGNVRIHHVAVYAVIRDSTSGTVYSVQAKPACYVGGTLYEGDLITLLGDTTYRTYFKCWSINPSTGVAWTLSDIESLEIGISLRGGGGGVYYSRCTQVYAVIAHEQVPAGRRAQSIGPVW